MNHRCSWNHVHGVVRVEINRTIHISVEPGIYKTLKQNLLFDGLYTDADSGGVGLGTSCAEESSRPETNQKYRSGEQ